MFLKRVNSFRKKERVLDVQRDDEEEDEDESSKGGGIVGTIMRRHHRRRRESAGKSHTLPSKMESQGTTTSIQLQPLPPIPLPSSSVEPLYSSATPSRPPPSNYYKLSYYGDTATECAEMLAAVLDMALAVYHKTIPYRPQTIPALFGNVDEQYERLLCRVIPPSLLAARTAYRDALTKPEKVEPLFVKQNANGVAHSQPNSKQDDRDVETVVKKKSSSVTSTFRHAISKRFCGGGSSSGGGEHDVSRRHGENKGQSKHVDAVPEMVHQQQQQQRRRGGEQLWPPNTDVLDQLMRDLKAFSTAAEADEDDDDEPQLRDDYEESIAEANAADSSLGSVLPNHPRHAYRRCKRVICVCPRYKTRIAFDYTVDMLSPCAQVTILANDTAIVTKMPSYQPIYECLTHAHVGDEYVRLLCSKSEYTNVDAVQLKQELAMCESYLMKPISFHNMMALAACKMALFATPSQVYSNDDDDDDDDDAIAAAAADSPVTKKWIELEIQEEEDEEDSRRRKEEDDSGDSAVRNSWDYVLPLSIVPKAQSGACCLCTDGDPHQQQQVVEDDQHFDRISFPVDDVCSVLSAYGPRAYGAIKTAVLDYSVFSRYARNPFYDHTHVNALQGPLIDPVAYASLRILQPISAIPITESQVRLWSANGNENLFDAVRLYVFRPSLFPKAWSFVGPMMCASGYPARVFQPSLWSKKDFLRLAANGARSRINNNASVYEYTTSPLQQQQHQEENEAADDADFIASILFGDVRPEAFQSHSITDTTISSGSILVRRIFPEVLKWANWTGSTEPLTVSKIRNSVYYLTLAREFHERMQSVMFMMLEQDRQYNRRRGGGGVKKISAEDTGEYCFCLFSTPYVTKVNGSKWRTPSNLGISNEADVIARIAFEAMTMVREAVKKSLRHKCIVALSKASTMARYYSSPEIAEYLADADELAEELAPPEECVLANMFVTPQHYYYFYNANNNTNNSAAATPVSHFL